MMDNISTILSSKFDIEKSSVIQTLDTYFEEQNNLNSTTSTQTPKPSSKPSAPKTSISKPSTTSVVPNEKKNSQTSHKCPYIYTKGDNPGKVCDIQAKNELNGKFYCSQHAKSEAKKMATTQTPPKETKTSKEDSPNTGEETVVKTVKSKTAPKTKTDIKTNADEKSKTLIEKITKDERKIKLNSFGNYVDAENNIIFDRDTGKALGNQHEDGKTEPLTKHQIDLCEMHNWLFDMPEIKKSSFPVPPPKRETKEELKIESEDELDLDEDEDIQLED